MAVAALSLAEWANGNLSHAARAAQMDRSDLRELLRRYQILTRPAASAAR